MPVADSEAVGAALSTRGFVVLTNLTIYGLLCVGDTVFDPFGDDAEDFAVP